MPSFTRRHFVASVAAGGVVACVRSPLIRTPLPEITHGVQAGDVQPGRALVWARCNEPAAMQVEWATTSDFASARRVVGPRVGPASDHTGTLALTDLPAAQTIHYRIRFTREAARGASAWVTGRFRTPPADRIRFAWSGDTCGQGFGAFTICKGARNTNWNYRTKRRAREWLSRSMIAVEAPGWRGATKAHTAGM